MVEKIVVSMKGAKRFGNGQAYDAFSRVKSMSGLYVTDFDKSGTRADKQVAAVMDEMRINRLPTQTETGVAELSLSCVDHGWSSEHSQFPCKVKGPHHARQDT